jgi:hypothetical protein
MTKSLKRSQIDAFEKLVAQLESLHDEMSVLSKKSPNDAVNGFKIKLVNSILDQCNTFLGTRYRPYVDFERFAVDELPSNSDVTFIIAQYIECAEKFRADHIYQNYGAWYWQCEGEEIRTATPKKLTSKRA